MAAGAPRRLWLLALASTACWLLLPVGLNHDSAGLLRDWASIVEPGRTTYYPPAYPVMLGLLHEVFGDHFALAATALQHVMTVLAAFWCWRLLAAFLPPQLAATSVLLAGLLPASLLSAQAICSEALASFLLIGSLHFAYSSHERNSIGRAVVMGVFAGLAGVTRVVPLVAALAYSTVLWLSTRAPGGARRWLVGVLAAALVMTVSAGWFWLRADRFCIVNSSDGHLFNRVVNEQGLLAPDGTATRRVLAVVGSITRHAAEHTELRVRLEDAGYSYAAAQQLLGDVAREALAGNWVQFGAYSAWRAIAQTFRNPEMPVGDEHDLRPVEFGATASQGGQLALLARRLRGGQALLWPLLVVGAATTAAWILLRRRSPSALAWLSAAPALLLAQAAAEQSLPRYTIPIVPLVAPLAFCLVVMIRRDPLLSEP